jgi:sugar phosphate isomerase/epimerase
MFKSRGAFLNLTHFDPADWLAQLEAVDRLQGLGHLELWVEFRPSRSQLNVMADLFADRLTIMHGPFIGMSLASEWEDLARLSLDRCNWAVEIAAYLECEVVTFHAGPHAIFDSHRAAFERLAKRLAHLTTLAQPRVTLENMPARGGASRETLSMLDNMRELIDLLPEICFTLDVGHCLQNVDDFTPFIEEHAERIANIHLHDGVTAGRSHMALGEGDLDVDVLLDTLDRANYSGYLTLETLGAEDTAKSWAVLREKLVALGQQDEEHASHGALNSGAA